MVCLVINRVKADEVRQFIDILALRQLRLFECITLLFQLRAATNFRLAICRAALGRSIFPYLDCLRGQCIRNIADVAIREAAIQPDIK